MNTTLTPDVMHAHVHVHVYIHLYSISHSILTMIRISFHLLIDPVTEKHQLITANLLVPVLPATIRIMQASAYSSPAMSAKALNLTRTLPKMDADASQVQILYVHMRNPILVLAPDAPMMILLVTLLYALTVGHVLIIVIM
jgi:hypothetical protein